MSMEDLSMPTRESDDKLSEFEQFRRAQVAQMEEDLPDDCCMVELPEGQFVRGH